MAASNQNNRLLAGCALLAALIATPLGAAEMPKLEGGFTLNADAATTDFRSDTVDLSGNVRLKQGPMSIEAQAAKAQNFRSDNSRWTFEKAVHIRTAEADLRSNSASAAWANGQIADARVEGSPAQFEQLGPPDRQVRGRAEIIEYDVRAGIIKLTNQVWFSNGKDEFRGDVVIYNVRDERLQINPGGQSSGRVRGIIRPRDTAGGTASTQEPAAPDSQDEPQIANESGA